VIEREMKRSASAVPRFTVHRWERRSVSRERERERERGA
jgi:hypothetical protein